MKNRKITMADVAKKAGVAPATVARVIYGNGYVAADKRKIIEKALKDTGYRPNVMARGLRTSRSNTLGLVVSEGRLNAFHPYIAHEVQLEALKHGYTVLTLNNNANADLEKMGVQRFLDQHVDAVIFCAAVDAANVRLCNKARVPIVQIEREIAGVGSFVLVDPQPGMTEAVSHLAALGHKHIAYIGGRIDATLSEKPQGQSVEALRLAAFERAMQQVNLTVDSNHILLGDYYAARSESPSGYAMMKKLLLAKPKPTAVIAGADLLAAGALQAIGDLELSVPGDISLIGYDDTMAEVLTPPLTTIAQPILDLGQTAVLLAMEAIKTPERLPDTKVFATRLILRNSTGRPR